MSTMPFPMTLPGGDSSGVAAKSTGPRWALTATGFVVYFVLGVFVAMAIEPLVGAFTFPVRLAFGLVPAVVAAIRGATVAAVVKPDGLYVRNRWRQQTIPWSEVGSVDESASIGYTVVLSIRTLLWMFGPSRHNYGHHVRLGSSLFSVHREGHRFGIPLYATLGHPMGPHQAPFRAALTAADHPVHPLGETAGADPPTPWAAPQPR